MPLAWSPPPAEVGLNRCSKSDRYLLVTARFHCERQALEKVFGNKTSRILRGPSMKYALNCLLQKISLVHSIVNTSFPTQFPGCFCLKPRKPFGARVDLIHTGSDWYPRQWSVQVRCVRTLWMAASRYLTTVFKFVLI